MSKWCGGGGAGGYAGGKDTCDVLMSCGFVALLCVVSVLYLVCVMFLVYLLCHMGE